MGDTWSSIAFSVYCISCYLYWPSSSLRVREFTCGIYRCTWLGCGIAAPGWLWYCCTWLAVVLLHLVGCGIAAPGWAVLLDLVPLWVMSFTARDSLVLWKPHTCRHLYTFDALGFMALVP